MNGQYRRTLAFSLKYFGKIPKILREKCPIIGSVILLWKNYRKVNQNLTKNLILELKIWRGVPIYVLELKAELFQNERSYDL